MFAHFKKAVRNLGFGSSTGKAHAKPNRKKARLSFESLERREMYTANTLVGPLSAPAVAKAPALISQATMPQAAVTAAAANMAVTMAGGVSPEASWATPEVFNALEAARMNRLTVEQRMLLFVNNDRINRARLNGWIPDSQYQAAQADFKSVNEALARRAAVEVGGEFTVQVSKKDIFSPGTDSDYIIKLKNSFDPVADVKSMQRLYNTYVNQALEARLGKDAARALYREDWHVQLDVDFMVDPKYATPEQFKQIAELNNAAYSRKLAADFERVSRAPMPEVITDAHLREYSVQMQELMKDKQAHLAKLDADPRMITDPTFSAEYQKLMSLEQKYIERMEAANVAYRKQQGLPVADPLYPEPHYEFSYTADGRLVVSYRTSETIAAQGAIRTPQNLRMTGTASYLSPLTSQQALSNIAETMVEAKLKTVDSGLIHPRLVEVGQDIAKVMDSLPLVEKERLVERLQQRFGNKVAKDVVTGMEKEYGPAAAEGSSLDQAFRNALGVSDDLRQMSALRRSFNQTAAEVLGILEKPLGVVGNAMLIKDTVVDMYTYWTSMRKALDPNTSEAERDLLFDEARRSAQSMFVNGVAMQVFTKVPTLGAAFGTYMLSYTGSRYILENTKLGQWIDFKAEHYAERFLQSYDRAVDRLTEFLGGTSDAQTRQDQLLALEGNLIRLIKEGKIRLNDGVTGLQVLQYIRSGDLWGLDELIKKDTSSDVVALKFTPADHAGGAIALPTAGNMTISDTLQGKWVPVFPDNPILVHGQRAAFSIKLNKGDFVSIKLYVPYLTDAWGTHTRAGDDKHIGLGGIFVTGSLGEGVGTIQETKTYQFNVENTDWEGEITAPFTLTISVTPAKAPNPPQVLTPDMAEPGPSSTMDQRVGWLNSKSASQAADVVWQYGWGKMIATLDQMTAARASQLIWNYSWPAMTATLDHMNAKRAGDVIWSYNWSDLTATLDHMSAPRVAEVLSTYDATKLAATLDHMSTQRIAEVFGNRRWTASDPLGGPAKQAVVARNLAGGEEAFAIASDNAIWHRWQTSANSNTWSSWVRLGGSATQLVAANNANGTMDIFYIGTDNAVWYIAQNSDASWNKPASLGGYARTLAVGKNADGRLEVFYSGITNAVCHRSQVAPNSGTWSSETSLGGYAKQIAVAQNGGGGLEVFYIGKDNAIWHRWQVAANSGSWSAESSLGGFAKQLAVAQNADGRLEVFYIGNDNAVWHRWQVAVNGAWSGQASLGGYAMQLTVGKSIDGRLEVFYIGKDNAIWHRSQVARSGAAWSAEESLGGTAAQLVLGQMANGALDIFGIDSKSNIWHRTQI